MAVCILIVHAHVGHQFLCAGFRFHLRIINSLQIVAMFVYDFKLVAISGQYLKGCGEPGCQFRQLHVMLMRYKDKDVHNYISNNNYKFACLQSNYQNVCDMRCDHE